MVIRLSELSPIFVTGKLLNDRKTCIFNKNQTVTTMEKILHLNSVDQYNQLYGLETLNPLISVIDLNKATRQMDYVHWNYGVYALYLKLEKACDIKYGRQTYDYRSSVSLPDRLRRPP